jgi:hypothetical protein
MTTNQQQIVDALVNEFNRIEAMHKPTTTFNLINVNALNDKTNEIEKYLARRKADMEAWNKLATEEAIRLVNLFKADLPTASVQKYDSDNGLVIRRDKNHSTHHEYCVIVMVKIVYLNDVIDSFGNIYSRGVKLQYEYNGSNDRFDTIEELVAKTNFLELVRKRVL